ncbi:MAG: thiamine pyrophosphate-binding protein [Nitrososphaerota archaeon]
MKESSSVTVSDLIVKEFEAAGIRYAFGLPGTQINPLLNAIRSSSVKYLNVRDEGAAAMMASAYSELSGEISVCLGIVPGAIKMLNGLYVAKVNRSPVLAITGTVSRKHMYSEYTQELDVHSLYKDVALFNAIVTDPSSTEKLVRMAIVTAKSRRGVSHLTIPEDVLEAELSEIAENSEKQPIERKTEASFPPYALTRKVDNEIIDKMVELLEKYERAILLVGKGGRGAREYIATLSEKLSIPVFSTFPGRSSIKSNTKNYFGVLWIFSPRAYQVMRECELIILVGTDYPYINEFMHDNLHVIQIDVDQQNIGKRCKVDIGVVGDAKDILEALTKKITLIRRDNDFLNYVKEIYSPYMEELKKLTESKSKPINIYYLIKKLESKVENDAIITTGAGTHEIFLAQAFEPINHIMLTNHRYAPVGSGLPKAIGAKLAVPEKQVINFEGDLSFQVCMPELITAKQYDVEVKNIIVNNGKQLAIKLEQVIRGYDEFATDIGYFDFVKFAEACGVKGVRVDDPNELDWALDEILSVKGPALLDVVVDPNQLPLF